MRSAEANRHDNAQLSSFPLHALVPEIHRLAKQGSKQDKRICRDKHSTFHEPAIGHKADRCGALANKKPLGNTMRGTVAPLRLYLPPERREENGGRCPANQFSRHAGSRAPASAPTASGAADHFLLTDASRLTSAMRAAAVWSASMIRCGAV
jgi:hypothetical protein